MPGNARRPGDILVTDDFGNDKPLALDVTVHSVQSSGVFSICARNATGLGATGLADAVKMKENVPECEMRGWECVPISIDIYGSFGVASDRFFDKLADRIAAHTRTSFYTALRLIRSKIGLVSCRPTRLYAWTSTSLPNTRLLFWGELVRKQSADPSGMKDQTRLRLVLV
jgi:hypothetical protein